MGKTFSILTLLTALYVGWIFIADNSQVRIERACAPTLWFGNVSTSLTALTLSEYQQNVEDGFKTVDYACRFTVWRLFFEQEYLDWMAQQEAMKQQQAQKPVDGTEMVAPSSTIPAILQ